MWYTSPDPRKWGCTQLNNETVTCQDPVDFDEMVALKPRREQLLKMVLDLLERDEESD